jgi:hypothetical protein
MNLDDAILMIAKRTGLHQTANKTDILAGLTGAMEEIGTNIEIWQAQSVATMTLASNANSVIFPNQFQRVLSVRYQYPSGSDTIKNDLDKKSTSEFDRMNSGKQGVATDGLEMFMISGRFITVGPGVADTGGSLLIRGQRVLTTNDIQSLPNTMLAVHGAVANLLPDLRPDGTINNAAVMARRSFAAGIGPSGDASVPTQQEYDQIRLGPQMIDDDLYRGTL